MKKPGFVSFLFLGNLLFLVVSIPMILTWAVSPKDTFYTGVHATPIDYYHYLSVIKEGMNGSWLASDLYNTEPHQQSLVFIFFIIIGKIGGVFHLSSVTTYHLFRIIGIECMLVSLYAVCKEIAGRKYAFWSAVLGLFSTVPPIMYIQPLQAYIGDTAWWDVLDPLHRADYLPHHSFGIAFLFITAFFILRFIRLRQFRDFVLALLPSFLAGMVYPIAGFTLIIVSVSSSAYYLLRQSIRRKKVIIGTVFPIGIIAVCAFAALLIMKGEISKGYPWNQYNVGYGVWTRISNFDRNFFLASGLVFLLGVPFVIRSLVKGDKFSDIFVSFWALTPMALIIAATPLGLEKIRMAYLGQFGAYGILATLSLVWLSQKLKSTGTLRIVYISLGVLLSCNVVLVSGYYLHNRLLHQVYGGEYFHFRKGLLPAYSFINSNVPMYSYVDGDFLIGSTLPGFATVKTYFGHWTATIDYWNKEDETMHLLRGSYSPQEALEFFARTKIGYIVVYNKEQREAMDNYKSAIPLKTIYKDGDIRIYKVGEKDI
jgi:hypothetical protein